MGKMLKSSVGGVLCWTSWKLDINQRLCLGTTVLGVLLSGQFFMLIIMNIFPYYDQLGQVAACHRHPIGIMSIIKVFRITIDYDS